MNIFVKFVLIICCILFTAAFVFDVVSSAVHREYVEREMYNIKSKLDHLEVRVGSINRENGELFEKLNDIEEALEWITRRISSIR
jgi:uncharacterized protein YoxC